VLEESLTEVKYHGSLNLWTEQGRNTINFVCVCRQYFPHVTQSYCVRNLMNSWRDTMTLCQTLTQEDYG